MPERRVYVAQMGTVRAHIVARGSALILFDAKVQNDVVRQGLLDGGVFWLGAFLPKRFGLYAYKLGYRVSEKWRKAKEFQLGAAIPFIGGTPVGGGKRMPGWEGRNGEKMITAALNSSRVIATATRSNTRITWRIPYGHPVPAEHSAAFRTLPTWEVERIAEVVGKSIDVFLNSGALQAREAQLTGRSSSLIGRTSSLKNIGKTSSLSERPFGAPTVRAFGMGTPRPTGASAARRIG